MEKKKEINMEIIKSTKENYLTNNSDCPEWLINAEKILNSIQ